MILMTFHVVIFSMMKEYEDQIILGLAKKSYRIKPINYNNSFIQNSGVNFTISCAVEIKVNEEKNIEKFFDEIKEIINIHKMKIYGLVISGNGNLMWCGSNIQLPPDVGPSVEA